MSLPDLGILAEGFGDHVSWAGYLVVLVAVLTGALVQGSIGFGAALVAVPILALVAPEALPATIHLWAFPLTLAMAVREWDAVDWGGVGWIAIGRLPGSLLGAWVVTAVATRSLTLFVGGAVLAGVAASAWAATIPFTRASKGVAGFVSGLMGTATSIGGPPLALLYQQQPGKVLRSTLAASFLVGTLMSVLVLTVADVIQAWHVVLAVALLPGLVGGLALSRPLSRVLDDRWLRPTVLVFAAATALVAVARGLIG